MQLVYLSSSSSDCENLDRFPINIEQGGDGKVPNGANLEIVLTHISKEKSVSIMKVFTVTLFRNNFNHYHPTDGVRRGVYP